jgi:hypothetical protein
LGALIPLAISIAPEIARWLFGDSGSKTTAAVAQAVQAVTGTTDETVQQIAIERDPQLASQLRIELSKIAAAAEADARKSDLAMLSATLADTASARAQTVALAQAKSPIGYGAPVVSGIVLATFGAVMALALTRTMPAGSETILNMLLGSLAAMATSVVSYWVGSSVGSARKDGHIAQLVSSR